MWINAQARAPSSKHLSAHHAQQLDDTNTDSNHLAPSTGLHPTTSMPGSIPPKLPLAAP